ncbi:hypothetical protein PPSIR1_14010 [Plesiocystis pacifica SIR-1]|uniref:DUF4345 domain-containing protein n=1 Tax=Plesiocystis pacifica SIR-1 TaxID=391625 RepID=A6G8Y7_9BACT|nr:DUF4345 domain-containing protein [Plesiocystis pacifica]EDM77673.1 hypothetical protein PPSIR1_14010 [Plesiocystis pacifica SIR-1]
MQFDTPSRHPRSRPWPLIVGGLALLGVGLSIFLAPLTYQANMGVELPAEATLLSDMRAMAGSLIGVGALLLAGARWVSLTLPAALAGAVLYLSYGLSRLVSMAVDGLPDATLIASTIIELTLGTLLAVERRRGV